MKTIQQAMIEEIYTKAVEVSHKEHQAIHDEQDANDGEHYITIRQLDEILKTFTE